MPDETDGGDGRPCPICKRDVPLTSDHHLVPKSRGGKRKDILPICLDCHNAVHVFFTNQQLAADYSTVESLLAEPRFRRHVDWLRKQDPGKRSRSTRKQKRSRRRGTWR